MEKNYPIILLPGYMCDYRAYLPQIDTLKKRHKVHVADLTLDSEISSMAKRTLSKAPAEFIILGHSMGGITGLEILRQEPSRVKAAIFMATNPENETEIRRRNRELLLQAVKDTSLQEVTAEKLALQYFTGDCADLRSLIVEMSVELGEGVLFRQASALINRINSVPSLCGISIPTLLIGGARDNLVSPKTLYDMAAKISSSDVIIVKEAGHFPGLERPDETNVSINQWIARIFS